MRNRSSDASFDVPDVLPSRTRDRANGGNCGVDSWRKILIALIMPLPRGSECNRLIETVTLPPNDTLP
jgi:hypothetical protein